MIQGGEQFCLDFCLQIKLSGGGLYGAIRWKEGSVSPIGKHATVFWAKLYTILNYVYEIEPKGRPEE